MFSGRSEHSSSLLNVKQDFWCRETVYHQVPSGLILLNQTGHFRSMGAFDIVRMAKNTLVAVGTRELGTFAKRPMFYRFLVSSLPVAFPGLLDSWLSKLCL